MIDLLNRIEDDDGGNPMGAVVFDRFHSEEVYSFRIRDERPNALLVLDMQDVHSLRCGRQMLVEESDECEYHDDAATINPPPPPARMMMTRRLADDVMRYDPTTHPPLAPPRDASETQCRRGGGEKKAHDAFLRELASVHRMDLVLVCSEAEMRMLASWGVPRWKLVHAPFFCSVDENDDDDRGGMMGDGRDDGGGGGGATSSSSSSSSSSGSAAVLLLPSFGDRSDYAFVGGFRHPPNVDSVRILRREIWPAIRSRLPHATIRVCGAYPTPEVLSLHDPSVGFLVEGKVDDVDALLRRTRVLLAPLRFGAGIKGKIVDAWRCDCPVVTTSVGAEGMTGVAADEEREEEDDDDDDDDEQDRGGRRSQTTTTKKTTIARDDSRGRRWGGLVEDDAIAFANAAVELHEREELWNECREDGSELLRRLFDGGVHLPAVEAGIRDGMSNLEGRRRMDVFGSVLWRDGSRATEYFSRWIELKETSK
jgi:hypothetical protein